MMSLPTDGTAVRPALSTQTALLVVDVQEYCSNINKGNDYYAERSAETVSNINMLAAEFRSKPELEVVFTYLQALTSNKRDISTDYKLSGPLLCNIPGPNEKNIFMESCQPKDSDILIPKTSCSVFHSTNIHYVLSNLGIRHLVIVGQLTDQCITSAARDAADLGYFVTVVPDACVARSPADEDRGRQNVNGFCRLLSTEAVLKEVRAAQPPEYKLLRAVASFLKSKGHEQAARMVLAEFCKEKPTSSPGTQATEAPSVDSIIDLLVQAPVPTCSEEKDNSADIVEKNVVDADPMEAPKEMVEEGTQEGDNEELGEEKDEKEESSSSADGSFLLAEDSFLKAEEVEQSPVVEPVVESDPTTKGVSNDPPTEVAGDLQEPLSDDDDKKGEIPIVVEGSRSFLSNLTDAEDEKVQTEEKKSPEEEGYAVVDQPAATEGNAKATTPAEPTMEEPMIEEEATASQVAETPEQPVKKESKEVSFIGLAKLLQGTNKNKSSSVKGRSKITDKDITTVPRRQLRDPAGVKKETKSFIGRTF